MAAFPFLAFDTLISFVEGGGATWKDALSALADLIAYAKDQLGAAAPAFAACPATGTSEEKRAWLVATLKHAKAAHTGTSTADNGPSLAVDWRSLIQAILALLAGLL